MDFRLPNIHGSDKEQLAQMKSYLYQLVGDLQWALDNVSAGSQSVVVQTRSGAVVPSASHSTDIETTFGALKPLIIKSADIVKAYYEEIDSLLNLEGSYVADSDFGKFVQNTKLQLSATSDNITQNYTNIQTITTNLGTVTTNLGTVTNELGSVTTELGSVKTNLGSVTTNLGTVTTELGAVKNDISGEGGLGDRLSTAEKGVKETKAHIKTGLLDRDDKDTPVYGIEIKQMDRTGAETVYKSARFTAGMLCLYDAQGRSRVIIENQKCKMPSVEIKDNAKLGAFMLDFEDGLRLKWVGE